MNILCQLNQLDIDLLWHIYQDSLGRIIYIVQDIVNIHGHRLKI